MQKYKIIFSSFLLSILFIWIVGYFFCDSLLYSQHDHTLHKRIYAQDITYRQRSEGFASTHIGKFGINAIEDITALDSDKIVIWGDSYVEAFQVDDSRKMAQVATNILSQGGFPKEVTCFAVGMSGDSVADYYFDIPKYESLIKYIRAHVIVITDLKDILPDQSSDTLRGVFKSSPLRFEQHGWHPKFQKIKKALNYFKLYFLWNPFRSLLPSIKTLNFIPFLEKTTTRNKKTAIYEVNQIEYLNDSWNFLLKHLRNQTKHPIAFIYCPSIPQVKNGKILYADKEHEKLSLFVDIAKKYNISVIDASDAFCDFYKNTGFFPRGFQNSDPSRGHFNQYGHKIIAQIISSYVKSQGFQ